MRTPARQCSFRIHDILVWIRIRGSMPLTNESRSGSWIRILLYHHWPSRCHKKKFETSFSAYYLIKGTFTSFFKDKSKWSHKTVGIKIFLTIFLADRRIRSRIRIHTSDYRIRIREAQKHVDPDPVPEHCYQEYLFVGQACDDLSVSRIICEYLYILLVTEKNDDSTQPREESACPGTGILSFALYVSSIDESLRSANKSR
jgi:hypothetical protein